MVGLDLAQHHGDGLRIFVLEIVGQHRLVDVAQLVPHGAAGRTTDFFHDHFDAVFVQRLEQQALGAFQRADQRAGGGDLIGELDEQPFDHGGIDRAEIGHGLGNLLDFLVVHHREQLGRLLLAERQHQDRRLLRPRERTIIFFHARHFI